MNKDMSRVDTSTSNIKDNINLFDGTCIEHLHRKVRKDSQTQEKGISYNKKTGRYKSGICVQGKQITIGTFDTLEDAKASRKEYERIFFGRIEKEFKQKKEKEQMTNFNEIFKKVDINAGKCTSRDKGMKITKARILLRDLPEELQEKKFTVYMSNDKSQLAFHFMEKGSIEETIETKYSRKLNYNKHDSQNLRGFACAKLTKILIDNGWERNKIYDFTVDSSNIIIKRGE